MATLTIRRLDERLVARLKARAARNGSSMEEEVRKLLDQVYGSDEQIAQQRAWAKRQLARLKAGKLPKNDMDSAALIEEMREERDRQLTEAIEGPRGDRR